VIAAFIILCLLNSVSADAAAARRTPSAGVGGAAATVIVGSPKGAAFMRV
jgi:hypothetical protein